MDLPRPSPDAPDFGLCQVNFLGLSGVPHEVVGGRERLEVLQQRVGGRPTARGVDGHQPRPVGIVHHLGYYPPVQGYRQQPRPPLYQDVDRLLTGQRGSPALGKDYGLSARPVQQDPAFAVGFQVIALALCVAAEQHPEALLLPLARGGGQRQADAVTGALGDPDGEVRAALKLERLGAGAGSEAGAPAGCDGEDEQRSFREHMCQLLSVIG